MSPPHVGPLQNRGNRGHPFGIAAHHIGQHRLARTRRDRRNRNAQNILQPAHRPLNTQFSHRIWPRVQRIFVPFLSAFYSIPKIALAPLFVIILGIGIESKICLVAVTVFFLLLFATMDGMRDIDEDFVESLQIMGATPTEIATKLVMPAAKPWIFTGMRISVRYAMTAAILGEVIASNQGIGFLIEYNSGQFNAAGVFAAVVLLVLFGVAVTEFLTRFERGSAVEKLPF